MKTLIVITVLLLLAFSSAAQAAVVNLGAADMFRVLSMDGTFNGNTLGGKVILTGAGSPVTSVQGNIGVALPGKSLVITGGANVSGALYLASGAFLNGSSSTIQGGVVNNYNFTQANADALSAYIWAAGLPTTMSVPGNHIDDSTGTIVGGAGRNVINVSYVALTSSPGLTLYAPSGGSFVIQVTGAMSVSGLAGLNLTGGLTPDDVMFNVQGIGTDVSFSSTSSAASWAGVLMVPQRRVSFNPGFFTGNVISGGDISVLQGAQMYDPVPEPTGLMALSCGIAGIIGMIRRRKS